MICIFHYSATTVLKYIGYVHNYDKIRYLEKISKAAVQYVRMNYFQNALVSAFKLLHIKVLIVRILSKVSIIPEHKQKCVSSFFGKNPLFGITKRCIDIT